jgi:uncharacterized protein YndB with AHSA1/START domain
MAAESVANSRTFASGALGLARALLLGSLILTLGCQAAPQLVAATPGIYMSLASGVRSDVVNFQQIGAEVEVSAPADKVWQTLTDTSNIPLIYPWMTRLERPTGADQTLDVGESINYETVVAKKKVTGTAVVTSEEANRQLLMTLFSASHGTLEYRLNPADGKTRLSALLTTEIHNMSMVRPESEVKKDLKDALSTTLKIIKLRSEGEPIHSEDIAGAQVTESADRDQVPFDVVKGVCLIDASPQRVWKSLTQTGVRPLVLGQRPQAVPDARPFRLDSVGNGLPYESKVAPLNIKGTAVVTNVREGQELDLALLADFKGGAEFRLLPEDGKTRFSCMYYMQFPAEYRGKPLDRKMLVDQMQRDADQVMKTVQSISEGGTSSGT